MRFAVYAVALLVGLTPVRARPGYGQAVHFPSGVYRIRVGNRVISVWVP